MGQPIIFLSSDRSSYLLHHLFAKDQEFLDEALERTAKGGFGFLVSQEVLVGLAKLFQAEETD